MGDTLGNVLGNWRLVLDSVMPGGRNWQSAKNRSPHDPICHHDCPHFRQCESGNAGPNRICMKKGWRKALVNPKTLVVILHVIEYFDYYNLGDLKGLNEQSASIVELRRFILSKLGRTIKGK
jgi:hypothetical protein